MIKHPHERRPARHALASIAATLFTLPAALANAQSGNPPAIVAVCAPCHGADGGSGNVLVPVLAGQRSIYLRRQLLAFRAGTRRHPDMKPVARDLTDREIEQLVVYYSSLPAP